MKIGPFTIDILSDGRIWLDGGAMFGVVPKPLWSKTIEVDEKNRVPLETRSLLIRGDAGTILVETGIGDHYDEKMHQIYKFDFSNRLLEGLSGLGVAPEDVDMVIQTHLHFDHCGTLAQRSSQGSYGTTFPNAEIVVQKGEWNAALNPDFRSRPSYFPKEFYEAVEANGKVWFLDGNTDLLPGISTKQLGGHTLNHQGVEITHGDEILVFVGDFIPMTRHVNLAYSMSYDMLPITTVEHKQLFLPQAQKEGWIIAFVHDPDTPLARIVQEGRKWKAVPLPPE